MMQKKFAVPAAVVDRFSKMGRSIIDVPYCLVASSLIIVDEKH